MTTSAVKKYWDKFFLPVSIGVAIIIIAGGLTWLVKFTFDTWLIVHRMPQTIEKMSRQLDQVTYDLHDLPTKYITRSEFEMHAINEHNEVMGLIDSSKKQIINCPKKLHGAISSIVNGVYGNIDINYLTNK